jgi:hypothetical protein
VKPGATCFSSFPNYVAFFFLLSSTILRDFLPAFLDYDVVYRQQMKITHQIGDRTGEALGQFNLAVQDHRD